MSARQMPHQDRRQLTWFAKVDDMLVCLNEAGHPARTRRKSAAGGPRMIAVMESAVEKIKVWFRFIPREDWFPQDTEGLWATRLSADTATVENVPFLQDGVAEGDVVRFQTDSDGLHWAVGRVSSAGNCTIRVVPIPTGPLGGSPRAVHQRLSAFRLGGEVFSEDFPMVAFNAPAGADFTGIKALLNQGQVEGWWHYEVGCGTNEWWNA